MTDERLGHVTGELLRDCDRPAPHPLDGIDNVMAEIRATPQARRGLRLPFTGRRSALETGGGRRADIRDPQPPLAPTGGSRAMFTATRLVAAGAVVALAGTFLAIGITAPDEPQAPGAASPSGVSWSTSRVSLAADDFTLEVNDLTFGDDVFADLHSDPGDDEYWTLEASWREHDVGQRLYMYFGADGTDWWVDEIRTYDGHEEGEWVFAYGPFFQTPLGQAFEGDIEVDLLGEGRPGAPNDVVPAVLSIKGMHLAVAPGSARDVARTSEDEEHPVPVEAEPGEERYGPDEEYPSAEVARLDRALMAAFGDPQRGGGQCRSIEEARVTILDVLGELGETGWSVAVGDDVRDDGCAVPTVRDETNRIMILTGLSPDVVGVLDQFLEDSLDQCLDTDTAIGMLTERLEAISHQDFVVKASDILGGPGDRMNEIRAHADAGCAFYVASGGEADGTLVYHLHGE